MKSIQATLIGVAIASALVLTAQSEAPEDMAARTLQAQDEQSLLATWDNWHPEATHRVLLKYRPGQQDDSFSYRISDSADAEETDFTKALEGHSETARSELQITARSEEDTRYVTAVSQVDYEWQGYAGKMRQTDEFVFETYLGGTVIRSLTTTCDYR